MSEMDKRQEPFRGSKDQRSSQEGSLAGISTGNNAESLIAFTDKIERMEYSQELIDHLTERLEAIAVHSRCGRVDLVFDLVDRLHSYCHGVKRARSRRSEKT